TTLRNTFLGLRTRDTVMGTLFDFSTPTRFRPEVLQAQPADSIPEWARQLFEQEFLYREHEGGPQYLRGGILQVQAVVRLAEYFCGPESDLFYLLDNFQLLTVAMRAPWEARTNWFLQGLRSQQRLELLEA